MQQTGLENTKKLKHKKPWYRIRNLILFFVGVIGSILGWMTYETVALMNADPNIAVDYRALHQLKVTEMTGVSLEDAHKVWDELSLLLENVELIINQVEDEMQVAVTTPRWRDDYMDLQFTMMLAGKRIRDDVIWERKAISALQDAGIFEHLSKLNADSVMLDSYPFNGELMIQQNMPELRQARLLARTLAAYSRIALESNKLNESAQKLSDCLALGKHIGYQHNLVSWLVGGSIHSLTLSEITSSLLDAEFDEQTCRYLLKSLDENKLPPTSFGVGSEKLTLYDMIQHFYSDNSYGDGYLMPDLGKSMAGNSNDTFSRIFAAFRGRFLFAPRSETVEALNSLIDPIITVADQPITEYLGKLEELENYADVLSNQNKHRITLTLLPSFRATLKNGSNIHTVHEGSRLMVAIELFEAMHHRLPTKLEELVPEILDDMPVDFTHGGSFIYRVFDEPDEHGRTYLLYSTGLDQHDDGGHYITDTEDFGYGEYTAIKDPEATGIDFVINRPRQDWWE